MFQSSAEDINNRRRRPVKAVPECGISRVECSVANSRNVALSIPSVDVSHTC